MLPQKFKFIHPWLHFSGLVMIAVGLPYSKFLMSLGQFWIILNWILEGRFWMVKNFFRSKEALMLSGLFFIYIPGLFYSSNLAEASKMLIINLPFLVLPFFLSQRPPIGVHWYQNLLRIFLLAVVTASASCLLLGLPRWLNGSYTDIRQISVFISHIRFSLLIAFSVLLISWMLLSKPFQIAKAERVGWGLSAIFLLIFLLILQSLTGILIIAIVGSGWGLYLVWSRLSRTKALMITLIPVILFLGIIGLSYNTYHNYFTPAKVYGAPLPTQTSLGNPYTHSLGTIENGYYIESFVNEQELEHSWSQRSNLPLRGDDGKGNLLRMTLIRYLNSKGLPKDTEGIAQLSDQDIRYVEQGIANVKYTGLWGIRMRFYQLLWEFNYYKTGHRNASGHTIGMKFAFWKTSLHIIRQNWLFGVGIGDVSDTFKKSYQIQNTWLDKNWWLNSHNQYLYIAVATGVFGLMLFIIFLLWPLIAIKELRTYPPFIFFLLIALISMLTEDTLTTQAGVTFVAFFYSVFLFLRPSSAASNTSTISPFTPFER